MPVDTEAKEILQRAADAVGAYTNDRATAAEKLVHAILDLNKIAKTVSIEPWSSPIEKGREAMSFSVGVGKGRRSCVIVRAGETFVIFATDNDATANHNGNTVPLAFNPSTLEFEGLPYEPPRFDDSGHRRRRSAAAQVLEMALGQMGVNVTGFFAV